MSSKKSFFFLLTEAARKRKNSFVEIEFNRKFKYLHTKKKIEMKR